MRVVPYICSIAAGLEFIGKCLLVSSLFYPDISVIIIIIIIIIILFR